MKYTKYIIEAYNRGYRINDEGCAISPHGKVLKPLCASNGYLRFNIRINKVHGSVFYHRLMAYQKYGELLFASDCVRHLNGDSHDNSYDNIEIGSWSDNMMDIPKEIRVRKSINANIKYKNIDEIRNYYNNCKSYKETMERYGISSKGTLYYILKNRE
jgi:hypothetical protein